MTITKTLLKDLTEEKNGFSFGQAWRHRNDSLSAFLPILREGSTDVKPNYITSTHKDIIEVRDTGRIGGMTVTNKTDTPVFIRSGTIFHGATQERATTRSHIVFPGQHDEVPVACVHQSHSINPNAIVTFGGFVPGRDGQYMQSANRNTRPDQNISWNADTSYYDRVRNMIELDFINPHPDDVLRLEAPKDWKPNFSKMKRDDLYNTRTILEQALVMVKSRVPQVTDQIGFALVDRGEDERTSSKDFLYLLEMFDLNQSWKAVREQLINKEIASIAMTQGEVPIVEYVPSAVPKAVKNVLNKTWNEKKILENDKYSVIGLETGAYSGEVVTMRDNGSEKVIHMTIARNSGDRVCM